MNNYEKAIKENKTRDFLLGKNEFFVRNRDYGDHDISSTYIDFLNFALENGEEFAFERIDSDLQLILEDDELNHEDIINILGYLNFYLDYRYNLKKFSSDWAVSEMLKKKIKDRLEFFQDSLIIPRILKKLSTDFNFNL